MVEIFDFIKCRIMIFTNLLPMYKISLLLYFGLPVIIITYFRYKNRHIHSIILASTLLAIWIIQVFIWVNYIIPKAGYTLLIILHNFIFIVNLFFFINKKPHECGAYINYNKTISISSNFFI